MAAPAVRCRVVRNTSPLSQACAGKTAPARSAASDRGLPQAYLLEIRMHPMTAARFGQIRTRPRTALSAGLLLGLLASAAASNAAFPGGKSSARLLAGQGEGGSAPLAAQGEIAADARAVHELSFRGRGQARSLTLLVFSGTDMSGQPGLQIIQNAAQWQQVRVPLASMPNMDLSRLRAIALSATDEPGPFSFEIEAFELR
ncbi:CIA30 family protein [Lysobacter gummosus]|uniref:hypothetical protein n=2 Tax=Lysobacteraceae TaxID=32033 RepID=UPI0036433494